MAVRTRLLFGATLWSTLACGGLGTPTPVPEPEPTPEPVEPVDTDDPGVERLEVVPYGTSRDPACPTCDADACPAPKVASASSSLVEGERVHGPLRLFDGDPATAWCEGDAGPGEGATLELPIPDGCHVYGIEILGGWFESAERLAESGRVRKLRIHTDHGDARVVLPDPVGVPFEDALRSPAAFELGAFGETRMLRIVLGDVFAGTTGEDTCVSEIRLLLAQSEE